jgi:UDP-N-acetylmuramyl tripeptide synthase
LESIQSGSHFASRREEQKRSSFYFCRVPNNEFNHSQNPSFSTGDNAQLVHSYFITEPTTYITTVGLYNIHNELLAVAKLSQPFKKDQNTEALIKVRLDF